MNDDLQNQQISGKLDNAQIFDCISIVTLSGFRKAERELESLIRPKKQWSLGKGPSIYFWYKCSVFYTTDIIHICIGGSHILIAMPLYKCLLFATATVTIFSLYSTNPIPNMQQNMKRK